MREIVGLVLGAVAGAAGALFATSPEGRALIKRIREEAQPEVERATTDWQPVLDELARAARLAAREVETAATDLRARIAEIAVAPPREGEPVDLPPPAPDAEFVGDAEAEPLVGDADPGER